MATLLIGILVMVVTLMVLSWCTNKSMPTLEESRRPRDEDRN